MRPLLEPLRRRPHLFSSRCLSPTKFSPGTCAGFTDSGVRVSPFLTGSFLDSARDNFGTFERAEILPVFRVPGPTSHYQLQPLRAESHDSGCGTNCGAPSHDRTCRSRHSLLAKHTPHRAYLLEPDPKPKANPNTMCLQSTLLEKTMEADISTLR
jgi:hypothetical protein